MGIERISVPVLSKILNALYQAGSSNESELPAFFMLADASHLGQLLEKVGKASALLLEIIAKLPV